jgi:hypothetical protein
MKSRQSNHFIRSNVRIYDNDQIRKDVFKNSGMIPKEEGDSEKKILVKGYETVMRDEKKKISKFQKK